MARTSSVTEVPVDRQGRLVIPRHLRDSIGPTPGVVRIREVDGGLLLERPASGSVAIADDGLPVLTMGGSVANEEVLAAIDAERGRR